jgi:hypothetical protein
MRRREFITFLGRALAAQPLTGRMPRRSECGGSACGWVKPISAALGRRAEAFNPRADDQGTAEKTFGGYFLISGEARR